MSRAQVELGARLRQAREQAQLSVGRLAQGAGVSDDALSRFENGHGGLGAAEMVRVARALGVPPAALIHPSAPAAVPPLNAEVFFKSATGAATLPERDQRALASGLSRARDFESLAPLVGCENLVAQLEPGSAPERNAHVDGYQRALKVRSLIPERAHALHGVRRLIEDRFGVLVLLHRFEDPKILGAACRASGTRLIAVNSELPETARRFVMIHELAHQGFDLADNVVRSDEAPEQSTRHWFDSPPVEKRANAFAAMVLVPTDALRRAFGPPRKLDSTADERALVERAAQEFGLGFEASAWHLHNQGYVERSTVDVLLETAPERERVTGFEEDTRWDGLERRTFQALAANSISLGRARELIGERALESAAASW